MKTQFRIQMSFLWISIFAAVFTLQYSCVANLEVDYIVSEEEEKLTTFLKETTIAEKETEKPKKLATRFNGKAKRIRQPKEAWKNDPRLAQVNHINCSFQNHFCNPSAHDVINKIKDQEITNATDCRNICIDDTECEYFTYINFRRVHSCFTLKSCTEKKPMCTVPSNCVSGHRDCKDQSVCPKLDHMEGEHSRWRCDGVNPYKEDIPAGTACHTSCPSWRNAAGKLITAKSTCQSDGSWSGPVPFPPGPLYFPPSLQKPDSPDMGCHCQPLNITYNPNLEDGAEFYCNPEMDWDNLPAKIDTNTQCNLLCDRMLLAITECKEGLWTGRPDLGYWCSQEMEPVGNWLEV